MAELSTKSRNALPSSTFAGPDRSYPIPDKAHAANAKARASQMVKKGKLSPGAKAKIDAKANAKLGEACGTSNVKKYAKGTSKVEAANPAVEDDRAKSYHFAKGTAAVPSAPPPSAHPSPFARGPAPTASPAPKKGAAKGPKVDPRQIAAMAESLRNMG